MFIRYLTRAFYKSTTFSLLLFLMATNSYAKPAEILVSIKPLHSLVSNITDGINQTQLLLTHQQSPHHFQLLPSQKRLINKANIFFYSSDNVETFVPALKNTTQHLQFVQLSLIPDINALNVRGFHSHDTHTPGEVDGHIWLSINNAKIISRHITQILSKHSPENATHYQKNLNHLLLKLDKLKQTNQLKLNKYKDNSYLVYHDAYQYFEDENQLTGAHFITTDPEHKPGIKRVRELRKLIDDEKIQCIFYEPPNIPALLYTLTENKSVKLSAIDPAGLHIHMGKQHYFQLLQQTASALSNCLSQ
ncbi:MAG: hypothetical protein DIZ80_15950 [endosymbiont of Galathealinum brachiosum]|uniref:High-affinity zinc uptake system protein ZnuA n=1 Tax=endosymbiont of Galathealinum brachiosum TaxID=2200906 RepID=A0A370DB93_9GAMM|nr:MAG: hypothetical protein DIZ80_15950 [endosymbiont of Galathealinum brachiosum]